MRGTIKVSVRAYDEGGYDIHQHRISVDGVTVWEDWINDDGTDYWTGKDMTQEVNAAYVRYGLTPPFSSTSGGEREP